MIKNSFNLLANNYISKKYPISLVHFVTNRCNARCSFCFIDFDDPNTFKGELSLPEIEKLSKTFVKVYKISILQAESPLLEKSWLKYLKFILRMQTYNPCLLHPMEVYRIG